MQQLRVFSKLILVLRFLAVIQVAGAPANRAVFLGWDDFSSWRTSPSDGAEAWEFESPVVETPIVFDQLILSWNTPGLSEGRQIRWLVEVWNAEGKSVQFILGEWANGAHSEGRTSINGQKDGFGRVLTDTLILASPCERLRISVQGLVESDLGNTLRMVGVSLLNSNTVTLERESSRAAWGVELAVPQRCQLDYPGGAVWCSPTSVSMLLAHWSRVYRRPEIRIGVSELAAQVYDPGWEGTGNWSFNTAFAGSFRGIRGYVVRLEDILDLESFVEHGIPVAVSISYNRLKGAPRQSGDGHFVVCTGFQANGDLIVNDPARQPEVRWTYGREDFVESWKHSHNTAYLVVPESLSLPSDPGGRWTVRLP